MTVIPDTKIGVICEENLALTILISESVALYPNIISAINVSAYYDYFKTAK